MNGKLLENAEESIEKLLGNKTISASTRAILETQRVMLSYLSVHQSDHEKVEKMWFAFKVAMWGLAALGVLVIGYFFELLVH